MSLTPQPSILVAEDDPDTAFLIMRHLRKLLPEAEFSHVHDGQEAIDWLSHSPDPALLITDLQMPGMNGLELIEWIRYRRKSSVPILVFSATSDPGHEVKCEQLGVMGFVRKDGNFAILSDRFRTILDQPGGQTPASAETDRKEIESQATLRIDASN